MPAYYTSGMNDFLDSPLETLLGHLVDGNASYGFRETESTQVEAWKEQILVLRRGLSLVRDAIPSASRWGVLLEFPIPRRQKRIDAVLLAHDIVFVLEFKSSIAGRSWSARQQVEDYALDLGDFHEPSRDRVVIPIVVAPDAKDLHAVHTGELIQPVTQVSPAELATVIISSFQLLTVATNKPIDVAGWNNGLYRPVPTIIEAANALYAGMSVRDITHSHSGLENLTATTEFILATVRRAQDRGEKLICFVTGIPGAGKTLVGLNLVHNREIQRDGRPAPVFMSGNGPLVDILREALAQDCVRRSKETNTKKTKKDARREVKTFIQNIHHFVQDNLERPDSELASENVIVFDEAQRAWDAKRNKERYKKRKDRWHVSEPEMVLKIMDRHPRWAVVIALVGGGQEIHVGEAGLAEWGRTIGNGFRHWRVLASHEALDGGESVARGVLFSSNDVNLQITREPLLHLQTCVRSHRAEDLAVWVNHLLRGNSQLAADITRRFDQFPILLTRSLDRAKDWLRNNTRGTRRCGLVASSGATRLRAYGIETSQAIREAYSYPHWFLSPREDVRSSYQLETVATEFEIQGLELDNVGVCWGGDFTWDAGSQSWVASHFSGDRWKTMVPGERYERTLNKYRVLLTRARHGLIVWVPQGNSADPTQNAAAMDETAAYLRDCGCIPLESEFSRGKGA